MTVATADSVEPVDVIRGLAGEVYRLLIQATTPTPVKLKASTVERMTFSRPSGAAVQTSIGIESTEDKKDPRPIWEVIEDIFRDMPKEVLDAMPVDGAENHDHYIYGWPKKNPR